SDTFTVIGGRGWPTGFIHSPKQTHVLVLQQFNQSPSASITSHAPYFLRSVSITLALNPSFFYHTGTHLAIVNRLKRERDSCMCTRLISERDVLPMSGETSMLSGLRKNMNFNCGRDAALQ
ncbi:hypothetical protein ANANG_G00295880, partial [Anguilla anguilla]